MSLKSQLWRSSICYITCTDPKTSRRGGGGTRDNVICQRLVGMEVRVLFSDYFYWVIFISLIIKNFPEGGGCPILEETNLVRSSSFEKECGRVIVYYNILQERAKKDNLLTSAIIRNAQFLNSIILTNISKKQKKNISMRIIRSKIFDD